jgi:hypothetical protein
VDDIATGKIPKGYLNGSPSTVYFTVPIPYYYIDGDNNQVPFGTSSYHKVSFVSGGAGYATGSCDTTVDSSWNLQDPWQ